jgi:hypothetical protein
VRRSPACLGLALVAALAGGAGASAVPGYRLDTTTTAGYRWIDIDGSKDKYREDHNLRSGLRLFTLQVDGLATAPDETPLDRFHLEVDTPGDEPFSTFRLTAADRSLYDLRVAFTRSKYFYDVPQLFELPVAGDVATDDLHDWNFVRTNGAVDLTVHAPSLPTLLLGYRLYRRNGSSTTTVDEPGGDTFLMNAPIDDTTHVGRVGTEFRALDTDVFLQQEYRRVNRRLDLNGPIDPAGLDPTDGSTLSFFEGDQGEHLDIPSTTVRLRRPIGEALELTGAYLYSHAALESDRTRTARGTAVAPFGGTNVVRDGAHADLSTQVADLGGTLHAHERVRLLASYRFDERSQSGSFDETGTLGPFAAGTGYHVRRQSVTGEVEVEPRDDLTLRAGMRYGHRDANFSQSAQDIGTDTVGAVGGLRWRPWSFLDLYARYENVQVDDPFRVPGDPARTPPIPGREVTLTFLNRATAGLRVEPRDWIAVSYQLVADSGENDTFNARTERFGNSVALTLVPVKDLTLFTSYTRRDLDSRADILTAPLYLRSTSLEQATEDILVSTLRYDFGLGRLRWSTGWDVAYVNVAETLRPRLEPDGLPRTFYDLDRIDAGMFVTLRHRWLEPTIEVRRIEYRQPALPRNDYDATIVNFKLTKRWGF